MAAPSEVRYLTPLTVEDYEYLYNAGVAAIFGPGTPVAYSAAKVLEILLGEDA